MLMHLHSMLWLSLLVFAASRVYARFFVSPWIAGLAFTISAACLASFLVIER